MKINKILKINNFGTFNNFQWQEGCCSFNQYNFLYGWNYCGKTTLSRIFRCFEKKEYHKDFKNAEFALETTIGKINQRDIFNDYSIRVFNEDFVKDNFQWNNEDADIDPVLILGDKSKLLEADGKNLNEQKNREKENLKRLKEEKKNKENEINKSLTDKASEIRNILGITNVRKFDKNSLITRINNIHDFYEKNILSNVEKNKTLDVYRSKKLEEIFFDFPLLKLSNFILEIKDILSKKINTQKIIIEFEQNPELSEWVRTGILLHKNKTKCQFCGQKISTERIDELNKHFSNEFDNLIEQITRASTEISNHIKEIENFILPDKYRFFKSLQEEYENKVKIFTKNKENYIFTLETLKKELNRKKEKPFDIIKLKHLSENTKEFRESLNKIKTIVNQHNSKIESFENEKEKAKEILLNHYTAEFIKKKDYFDFQDNVINIGNNISQLERKINNLNAEIEDINYKIKSEAIGVNKINKYLEDFFNDKQLKIKLMENGRYKLFRDKKIAKNLSTGEKDIISLVYFFAKLEETGFDFGNAIIFIDDPVSSLDCNHIFKVYGFISEKLKNSGQLIITTHNFEFFNLLKDFNRSDLSDKGNFYLLKKIMNKTKNYSCIENLPSVLLKYKSEYNYLFSLLKSFIELQNEEEKYKLLYIVPNIIRRFFEGYLYTRYPDGRNFKKKARTFLIHTNSSERQKALKIMDEYSHEQNPTHNIKFPDSQEIEDVINFILKTIEEKDEEHYKALCNSLDN